MKGSNIGGGTYVSLHLFESFSRQYAPGVCLQQDYSLPLALPFLPGQVSSNMGL